MVALRLALLDGVPKVSQGILLTEPLTTRFCVSMRRTSLVDQVPRRFRRLAALLAFPSASMNTVSCWPMLFTTIDSKRSRAELRGFAPLHWLD